MTSCCQHTLCHASWPRSASSLPARKWPECQHWAQTLVPNKPMLFQFLVQRLQTKTWSLSPEVAQFDGCCASVTSVHVPERTGLAKDWAGIVIATETAAGQGAIRCCNLENSCTFYAGEDSSKMDVGTWVCLCSVSAFIYACPSMSLNVFCSKGMTSQSLMWESQKFPIQCWSMNIFKISAFLSICASTRSLF